MDAAGALVSLSGQALRVLVIGLVYITRGGQNRQVWANALVDTGMFAHSRNPLYVANLLLFLGLAIVHNGWAMYLIVLPFFVRGVLLHRRGGGAVPAAGGSARPTRTTAAGCRDGCRRCAGSPVHCAARSSTG